MGRTLEMAMDRIVSGSYRVNKKNYDKGIVLGQFIYGTGQKNIDSNSSSL